MSGANLPYHLRPNKAVDRLIFLDFLTRLDSALARVGPSRGLDRTYEYIGMGGPQMEDFRIIHERFASMPMHCIEERRQLINRQKFNRPHTKIEWYPGLAKTFIDQYQGRLRRDAAIVWLDYTNTKRAEQMEDAHALLGKIPEMSVLKITLNANTTDLKNPQSVARDSGVHEEKLQNLKRQLGRFFPEEWQPDVDDVMPKAFPMTLLRIFERALQEGLANRPGWVYHLVSAFRYQDSGTTMLTMTGIVGANHKIRKVSAAPQIKQWVFARRDQALSLPELKEICVPDLTAKERMFINQLLPSYQAETIEKRLGFSLTPDDDEEGRKMLRQYVDYCLHCPRFERIAF